MTQIPSKYYQNQCFDLVNLSFFSKCVCPSSIYIIQPVEKNNGIAFLSIIIHHFAKNTLVTQMTEKYFMQIGLPHNLHNPEHKSKDKSWCSRIIFNLKSRPDDENLQIRLEWVQVEKACEFSLLVEI